MPAATPAADQPPACDQKLLAQYLKTADVINDYQVHSHDSQMLAASCTSFDQANSNQPQKCNIDCSKLSDDVKQQFCPTMDKKVWNTFDVAQNCFNLRHHTPPPSSTAPESKPESDLGSKDSE